jgi:putative ABC transport system ATP-binding protein
LLGVEAVSKTWSAGTAAAVAAVREASLAVAAGETVVVSGPSGSGKTTLLALCGGLLRPDGGRVVVDGVDLRAASDAERRAVRLRSVGFVFQRGLLLQHLSARRNVALVARAAGGSWAEADAAADALLARFELGGRADCHPPALSAGEVQRVALARALVLAPRVVLADEPTAHLDSANGARVAAELRAAARERGAALVVVTHDARLRGIGDRHLAMEDGVLRAMA